MKIKEIKSALDVPGETFENTLEYFKILSNSLNEDPEVLEIGAAWGRSTYEWMSVLPANSTLNVIDWWTYNRKENIKRFIDRGGRWIIEHLNTRDQKTIWEFVVSQHSNKEIINEVFSMNSQEYMTKNLKKTYDMVFFDGDHSYQNLTKELTYFSSSRILCGDDYEFSTQLGVVNAVNDFYRKNAKTRSIFVDSASRFWCIYNRDIKIFK